MDYRNMTRYTSSAVFSLGFLGTATSLFTENYHLVAPAAFTTLISSLIFGVNEISTKSNLENKIREQK